MTRPGDRREVLAYRRAVQMVFQDPFSSLNPGPYRPPSSERPLRLHQPALGYGDREDLRPSPSSSPG